MGLEWGHFGKSKAGSHESVLIPDIWAIQILAHPLLFRKARSERSTSRSFIRGDVMKTKISILLFALIMIRGEALAQSQRPVDLESAVPVQLATLSDQRFEPIYGQEPYETTCSREVFSHNESFCSTVSDTVCRGGGEVCRTEQDSVCNSSGCVSVPRRVCHNEPQTCTEVPRQVCEARPVYVTQHYSCTQYRTVVVGQRLVKTYQHQVEVRLEDPGAFAGQRLRLVVHAREDVLSIDLISAFPGAILFKSIERVRRQDAGDVESITSRIVIRRGVVAEAVRRIQQGLVSNLALGRSGVRFDLPGLAGLEGALRVRLALKRTPKVWFKTTLYDGEVSTAGLGWVSQGGSIRAIIPFQKIGLEDISNKRHELRVSVRLDPGSVLNIRDFRWEFDHRIEGTLEKSVPSF